MLQMATLSSSGVCVGIYGLTCSLHHPFTVAFWELVESAGAPISYTLQLPSVRLYLSRGAWTKKCGTSSHQCHYCATHAHRSREVVCVVLCMWHRWELHCGGLLKVITTESLYCRSINPGRESKTSKNPETVFMRPKRLVIESKFSPAPQYYKGFFFSFKI